MITSPKKTLGQVSEALLKNDAIRQSRRGPIKTALKQYSGLLGYSDLNQCPFEAYFQNDDARNRMIDEGASRTTVDKRNGSVHLGPDAVTNLKNNALMRPPRPIGGPSQSRFVRLTRSLSRGSSSPYVP